MSDGPNVLSAAVSPREQLVAVVSPLPISSGWIVVNRGLASEERMKIIEVSENGLAAKVERENPQWHPVASSIEPYTPLTFDRVRTQTETAGLYSPADDLWECGWCGAVVKDQRRHESWHGAP